MVSSKSSSHIRSHVFISAAPRSGHTLMRFLLNAHPDVCISPEAQSMVKLIERFPLDRPLSQEETQHARHLILADMSSRGKMRKWRADLESLREKVLRYKDVTVLEILDDMLLSYQRSNKPSARIIGNKKNYFCCAEKLKQALPDAKFIFIVRDPRAAVSSMFSKLFMNDLVLCAFEWTWCMRRGRKICRKFPQDSLEILYRDLVSNPEAACRKVCEFLDIPYNENMLNFQHQYEEEFKESGPGARRAHEMLSQPITTSRITSWKGELAPAQIATVEAIAGKEMKRYGYKRQCPRGVLLLFTQLRHLPRVWWHHFLLWQKLMRCTYFTK